MAYPHLNRYSPALMVVVNTYVHYVQKVRQWNFKLSKNNNTISEVVSNGGKSAARTQLKVKGEGGV